MKKSGSLIVFGMALLLVTVQSGNAQMRGKMRGAKSGAGQSAGMSQSLDLSAEQLKKINQLRLEYFQETSSLRIKILEKREQLSLLVYSEDYNEEKIGKTVDELAELEADLTKKELKLSHDIRSILTAEQQAKWDAGGGPLGRGPGTGMCGLGAGMMGNRGPGFGGGMMRGRGMMGPGMMGPPSNGND